MPRITLTLDSDEQYKRWLEELNKAGHGQSRWICSMVDRSLENPHDFSAALEIQELREENNELKERIKLLEMALEKERSEKFKLEHQPREGPAKKNVVAEILRRGGSWTQRQLLEAIGVDPVDMEAMQVIRHQLNLLVDAGFVEEFIGGWRWIQ